MKGKFAFHLTTHPIPPPKLLPLKKVNNGKICSIVDCLRASGLCEEDEVIIPPKEPTVIKINRDSWESPVL
jgi:hypothetical protein